jgi:HK97 family phage major capsid protein
MSKILELREKRAKVWEAAKAFLDSKRGNDGLLSPEDTATYEKMEAEVIALGKEIERLERQAAIDLELSKPLNIPITDKPTSISGNNEKTGRASDEYRQSFWNMMRGRRKYDVHNALQIGEDTEGGYLVPDDFERTLVEALEEENIFRQIANVITTSSGDKKIPVVASKGTASWVDEEGQIPESDDSFAQVSIGAYKLATMIKVSEELLNDSVFNLEQYIAKEFARRIGAKEEEAFFIGDGSGKPTGILADNGGGEIGVTAASATAITLDEIMDLFYSLKSPYRRNAVFIMNDSKHLIGRPFLSSNSIEHFYIDEQNIGIFDRPEVHRPRDERLFTAPYCLVLTGIDTKRFTMRAVYSDKDFVFRKAIYAIKGTFEQKNFLLNLTGLLNSELFAYFNLMTGSSVGVEREQRIFNEILDFPYTYSDNIANQAALLQELSQQGSTTAMEAKRLNMMIFKEFGLSDNKFVDYALNIQIPQLTESYASEAYRSVKDEDLKIYSELFYTYLSNIFEPSQKYISVTIYPQPDLRYLTYIPNLP